MSDGFDEVYVDTRRQLRGVAESLIAGPQYRASGTIRLAGRPNGFAGVALPLSVAATSKCSGQSTGCASGRTFLIAYPPA